MSTINAGEDYCSVLGSITNFSRNLLCVDSNLLSSVLLWMDNKISFNVNYQDFLLASTMLRLNSDTQAHPDLAGYVIFNHPIFCASWYIKSILDTKILHSLILGLDTIYAAGAFLQSQFDPYTKPIHFDVDSKLALSWCSITGEEFYQAIPLICGY
ncbi:hypothetical protein BYT27DRAFT_7208640 [Phlegmacium glaucopus]|nr:hypothetical protein BYT27DRAFT_7208640 [Phlegmacium glaucopus]